MEIEKHSFIIRVWNDSIKKGNSIWRGSIEHVGSKGKCYFSNLEEAVRFIQNEIGASPSFNSMGWHSLVLQIKNAINKYRNRYKI